MDGSVEEDEMSVEDYEILRAGRIKAFKRFLKQYSLAELEEVLNHYRQFAENHTSLYYEREIQLPDPLVWLVKHK